VSGGSWFRLIGIGPSSLAGPSGRAAPPPHGPEWRGLTAAIPREAAAAAQEPARRGYWSRCSIAWSADRRGPGPDQWEFAGEDQVLGDVAHLDVPAHRHGDQGFERPVGGQLVALDEDALGLLDDRPGLERDPKVVGRLPGAAVSLDGSGGDPPRRGRTRWPPPGWPRRRRPASGVRRRCPAGPRPAPSRRGFSLRATAGLRSDRYRGATSATNPRVGFAIRYAAVCATSTLRLRLDPMRAGWRRSLTTAGVQRGSRRQPRATEEAETNPNESSVRAGDRPPRSGCS
jgi:hypothetical protein